MLDFTVTGSGDISLVMAPFLGGSQREWTEVIDILVDRFRCVTVDLPGFGASSTVTGYSVEEMADALIEVLATLQTGPYILIGHSMAGKVAAVVARRLIDSAGQVQPPAALVLVGSSPPSPEPMDDSKREQMLGLFGSADESKSENNLHSRKKNAETYIRDNVAQPLSSGLLDRTVEDVVKMSSSAWTAWLSSGSKEDLAAYVGVLSIPVLIVAGAHDKALGPDAQHELTLPHFSAARMEIVDSSHLIPLEKPAELASLIRSFVEAKLLKGGNGTLGINVEYEALIESARVSAQTREVLRHRGQTDDPDYKPSVLSTSALGTLRSVLARIIPQGNKSGARFIDIGARLDQQLAAATGDGWRYAALPPDAEAYSLGLSLLDESAQRLHSSPFELLSPTSQDEVLDAAASGRLNSAAFTLSLWLEDVRANAVQIYIAHPRTLAKMGYSGIADGLGGFVKLGISSREAWEPQTR